MDHFSIVPVLDLKGGEVVHARAGARAHYRPIRSPLAAGSSPDAVLAGLLSLASFRCVYVADLDAIEGCGDHRRLIASLALRHQGVEFWVDAGPASAEADPGPATERITPVIGSESLSDAETLAAVAARLGAGGCVLSLDYRGERFVGPPILAATPALWPERVIAMTLERVGTGAGPDLARLDGMRRMADGRRVYAAGGVRGLADLERLRGMGLGGALVATALHDGRLSREVLGAFEENR